MTKLEAQEESIPQSPTEEAKDGTGMVGAVNLNKLTMRRPLLDIRKPLIESDKSLFQFSYKGNAPAPPCCSACGCVTKEKSGHRGKRRKVDYESESCPLSDRVSIVESCGKGDEAMSAEKELPEADPAVIIGSVLTKNVDLRRDVANLGNSVDSSVSAGVSAICNDQNGIIFYLNHLISQQPLDLHSVLVHVSKLEKKTAEFFPFINELPSVFHRKMLEFADATFKLKSVFTRLFCARSVNVPVPAVCDLAGQLVKINLEINMIIRCSPVGSGDEVTNICKAQNEEVVKMVTLFHEDKVDVEPVMKLVSSISEVNNRFLPLREFLPRELPLKLIDMYVAIFKLQRLCFQTAHEECKHYQNQECKHY